MKYSNPRMEADIENWPYGKLPIVWDEIKEDQYSYWLECLPPAAWIGGAFLVGEPSDHHAMTGDSRFQACKEEHGKFFASSRPMTRKEFHEMFHTKHALWIESLHDASARCSCGGWSYSLTGPATKAEIEEQFAAHVGGAR